MDEERRLRVKERQSRIADTLIRAADDARLRDDLLADPQSLFGSSAEGRPQQPQHIQDMRRQIISHLVERTTSDSEFRTLLRDDLLRAIRVAGLTPQMEQLRAELPVNAEVTAYGWGGDGWGGDNWGDGWGGNW